MHCPGQLLQTVMFVFKCKGFRDASFLWHFHIGQIYVILRTTHIHALLHVLSWLHHWLSPLITYFASPNIPPGYGPDTHEGGEGREGEGGERREGERGRGGRGGSGREGRGGRGEEGGERREGEGGEGREGGD